MKPLEKKMRDTLKEGSLVGNGIQPLARQMLARLIKRPKNVSQPHPGA